MKDDFEQPDINLPGRLPIEKRKRSDSILPDEKESMERKRRKKVQDSLRQHLEVVVHAREHPEGEQKSTGNDLHQNNALDHPKLVERQDKDGLPPKLSDLPPADPEARRDFDNEKNKQDQEKQLRLGNMPKFTTAPRPGGP